MIDTDVLFSRNGIEAEGHLYMWWEWEEGPHLISETPKCKLKSKIVRLLCLFCSEN